MINGNNSVHESQLFLDSDYTLEGKLLSRFFSHSHSFASFFLPDFFRTTVICCYCVITSPTAALPALSHVNQMQDGTQAGTD
ncbi:hypothetical protein BDV32DRAFT_115897 [Aspergillus pseudonomiae]|nr:hypothetical protein BDV32DRAFT_115897 [Aspergillus pseudonomiae]